MKRAYQSTISMARWRSASHGASSMLRATIRSCRIDLCNPARHEKAKMASAVVGPAKVPTTAETIGASWQEATMTA